MKNNIVLLRLLAHETLHSKTLDSLPQINHGYLKVMKQYPLFIEYLKLKKTKVTKGSVACTLG